MVLGEIRLKGAPSLPRPSSRTLRRKVSAENLASSGRADRSAPTSVANDGDGLRIETSMRAATCCAQRLKCSLRSATRLSCFFALFAAFREWYGMPRDPLLLQLASAASSSASTSETGRALVPPNTGEDVVKHSGVASRYLGEDGRCSGATPG